MARSGDTWTISGDLTIKGTSRPVSIDFTETGSARDPFGNVRVGFEGEVTVNRKDWDLTWNAALETGGVLVSDKVKLEFDISAIKPGQAIKGIFRKQPVFIRNLTPKEVSEANAVPIGNRMPMHQLASGKALLAALSDAELDRYFAETDRQRYTPSTVTTEKALRKDLAETRKTGFSWADEEFSLGIIGIGRVVTSGGEVIGALSVAIPKVRCDDGTSRRIEDLLERTAGLLETA